ncbi:accessory Sec-dependent serine-rich glycoprotein adhesin, partial [Streptococcus sp.]
MFFRRQKGQYRETDRVTRYKLVKSGKHWLRASTSLFGLFKVLRGGVDTTQVMTEVVENQTNQTITGLDIIRGIAATGAVLGGAVATQTKVFANEAVALEKTLDSSDALATHDTVVLGTTAKVDAENSASLSHSESESVSSSESVSTSLSASVSSSASMSTSASESASTSASVSASTSVNASQSMVTSGNSERSTTASETSEKAESVSKESQLAKEGLPTSKLGAPVLESAKLEKGLVDTNAEISSLAGVTAGAIATSEVSAKQQDENRKKLTKLSAEMGEYLAKAVGLPNSDAAIAKVNAAVTAIEIALANPKADLTETVKLATSARNSIVNAVLGAHSGQHDSRNGQAIERGTSPRASLSSHGTTASIESGRYDRNSNEVVWRINMHANSALHHVGLIADVDPNTTITRVTFNNGQEMEKRGGSGNEYVYDIRHDKQRNLEATIEVYATVNDKSATATLDARVATSSQPFTSADTFGDDTPSMHNEVATRVSHAPRMSRSIAVPNRAAGQSRAASNPPTITMPSDVTFYNDDAVTNFQIQLRDDRGMDKISASASNAIITGITSPNYPATNRRGPGDLWTYDYRGNRTGFQKSYNIDITGTVGRKGTAWEPYRPGTYPLEYTVTDIDNQTARAVTNFHIKGFNERQDPAKGTKVVVNDKANLSPTEREQVLANFKAANASLLSGTGSGVGSTDYKKGAEEGSISLANNGDVTITYRDRTSDTVTDNVKYGVEKATDTFYAVSDESLSNINPRSLVRPVGGASDFPSGTRFAWKQGQAPTMTAMGDRENPRTAILTVTHPDNTTTDLTYNYRVYQKIETKTNNGITGQFYAFKAASGGAAVGGGYANNIGGFSNLYINNDSLPSGTTFAYEYRLNNNASAPLNNRTGSPKFSDVWHTTDSAATTHRTTYTAKATYPTGRFGTPSAQDRALTSETSFTYTVVDPVAKQEYVTTVGNATPLNDIISNPGNALKNSNSSVVIPNGTTYEWVSRPDASAPGIYKKEAKVTLPQGSTTQSRNATNVPVTIKVRPNPPQISADQVTNTGGLPNKGITVTNALPNAQVTLTIG